MIHRVWRPGPAHEVGHLALEAGSDCVWTSLSLLADPLVLGDSAGSQIESSATLSTLVTTLSDFRLFCAKHEEDAGRFLLRSRLPSCDYVEVPGMRRKHLQRAEWRKLRRQGQG